MADYFGEMGWTPLEDGQAPDHFLHLARLFRDFNMFEELNVLNGKELAPPASKSIVAAIPNENITDNGIYRYSEIRKQINSCLY